MSTAISVGTATTYTLPNDWDQADRRLRLLEACHDPHTIARATALGVGPRWRCLEAGAGAGSIARWMSRQVGRRGHVLAVDIDTTLLSDTTAPNLEVRQLNLVTDQLPTSAFDFVHARLVLMHLAEREHVLDQLVGALRAGGIILLEEYDFACARATMSGPARPMLEGVLNVMEAGGARLDAAGVSGRPWTPRRRCNSRSTAGPRRLAARAVPQSHCSTGARADHRQRARPIAVRRGSSSPR